MAQLSDDCFAFGGPMMSVDEAVALIAERVTPVLDVEMMRAHALFLAAPERCGTDRLHGLEGPAIFAANHHSHLDAGLLITSLPEPHRHQVFAGAAADYLFDGRVKATDSSLVLNAITIERSKVRPSMPIA